MPDKTKPLKPKKFISTELKEEPEVPVEKEEEAKTKVESPVEVSEPKEKEEVLKVSSFSQLDTTKTDTKGPVTETPSPESELKPQEPAPTLVPESTSEMPGEQKTTDKPEKDMSSNDIKEWLKDVRPDTSKEVEKKGGLNFKVVFIFVLITAILGAVVGGLFYYKQGVSKTEDSSQSPTTQEVTSTPSPSPQLSQSVDLKTYSVSVLNGSGVGGEAARVKSLLAEKGFAEDKVKTGNADSSVYTSTTVSLKENLPEAVFEAIKDTLKDEYDVVKSDDTLDTDSTYDVIIIVGDRKAE